MNRRNVISFITTPGGEELALLPRAELDALVDAAKRAREVADYQAGRLPGLSEEEALEYANAPSPLAFWRKRAGLSQAALAERAGIAQNYLSDIENGKREGPVAVWMKLSAALGVPIDALVETDD